MSCVLKSFFEKSLFSYKCDLLSALKYRGFPRITLKKEREIKIKKVKN